MCTRYVLTNPADAIRDLFRVTSPMPNWPPSYNVAPTHIMRDSLGNYDVH